MDFYDRAGLVITLDQWRELLGVADYVRVALDTIGDGIEVSTIWLGMDHGFATLFDKDAAPIVFETMVFDEHGVRHDLNALFMQRYATEGEAILGHKETVEAIKAHVVA